MTQRNTNPNHHTYLVGGAVRDQLLNITPKDYDYVVTGATPEDMMKLGFVQVGKSFPVFLHPQTKCEYALARIERKNGHGYGGFTFDFAPSVTLEEDLYRRDLTINAMAQDEKGNIIDPYHGRDDLQRHILRHVGPAFCEDPLRVLRVARFAACLWQMNFTVAPETLELMTQIAQSGELEYLTAERIFQEFEKVLKQGSVEIFIRILRQCRALQVLFPEIDRLYGIPARAYWHPEVDTGIHMELCLQYASRHNYSAVEKFALFCHDFGKALTPVELLPSHHGHGPKGVAIIDAFVKRLKIPNEYHIAAQYVARVHSFIHTALYRSCSEIMDMFLGICAFRFPQRLTILLNCSIADIHGRQGFENISYSHPLYLQALFDEAMKVEVKQVVSDGFKGAQITLELNRRRLETMEKIAPLWKKDHQDLINLERKEDPNYHSRSK